jgi:ribulose-5-phosphate 4-epimerase/fuculose-1-phosphate aldolase
MLSDADRDEGDLNRETVATACRILGNLGLTHEALGHVSLRVSGTDRMLIKAKGPDEVGLRYATLRDVIDVDFDANAICPQAGLRPPSESYIHTWLYKLNPTVRSVIHIHPEHAVLLSICGIDLKPIYGAYGLSSRIAVSGVPVYQRSGTVSSDVLGREFAEFMGKHDVAMMRGHGVTVTGTSVEDATVRAIALCQLASMTYKAHLLRGPIDLPSAEIEALRAPLDENRRRGSAGGEPGILATWRYYVRLAGSPPRSGRVSG